MNIEELKDKTLHLSPKARAYLARELLASLDSMNETEVEKLWIDEAIRRDEELDSEADQAYPADEVLARTRANRYDGCCGKKDPQMR